jgi:hypothetical protein
VTFAVTLPACVQVPDNTKLIATYSEEYLLANVFCEIHKLACLGVMFCVMCYFSGRLIQEIVQSTEGVF